MVLACCLLVSNKYCHVAAWLQSKAKYNPNLTQNNRRILLSSHVHVVCQQLVRYVRSILAEQLCCLSCPVVLSDCVTYWSSIENAGFWTVSSPSIKGETYQRGNRLWQNTEPPGRAPRFEAYFQKHLFPHIILSITTHAKETSRKKF